MVSEKMCARIIKKHGKDLQPLTATNDSERRIAEGKFFRSVDIYDDLEGLWPLPSPLQEIDIDAWEKLHIIKYEAGGEYSWHADNEITDLENRKVTVVVPLNDEFEGGGLELMWPNPEESRKVDAQVGEAIIFPAFIYHRALPVTSGIRWSLVAWATGPTYR